jgi:hypothetical protein
MYDLSILFASAEIIEEHTSSIAQILFAALLVVSIKLCTVHSLIDTILV